MIFDFKSVAVSSPSDAKTLLLGGTAPEALWVQGALDLSAPVVSPAWPGQAVFKSDTALARLPQALKARRVDVSYCCGIEEWPQVLECGEFKAQGTAIKAVPKDWKVEFRLDLSECASLRQLPSGFRTGSLVLSGCSALEALPEGLSVYFLDLKDCTSFYQWPERGEVRMGNLNLSGCARLESLPDWLGVLSQLDVSGCSRLQELPEGLRVSSWVEVADSGLTGLPQSLSEAPLRYRGVPVSYREVFERESLEPAHVLRESNAERRRVLLELLGYERFVEEANAEILDADADAGGKRRLLKVELEDDEPLVVLAVFCPSTGHQYTLRVPPQTPTCRHAAAWIAGFDNPDDYAPLKETEEENREVASPFSIISLPHSTIMIDHLENLNGAPIWNFAPDKTRPAGHAVRLALDWDDYEGGQKWLDLFAQFLEEGETEQVEGLIVGSWDFEMSETSASIIEAIVAARERFPSLRALFIGDITSEENEISWIQQSDLSPILNAFPDLEFLGARGGTDLFFGSPNHAKLKVLVAESGGLDGRLVRALMSAQLPALEHLELYLGTENYGGTTTLEDLAPLLAGEVFPALRYLGLRDYDRVDELAGAVASAPVVSRIETLDLSLGTLTDEGAQKLLESPLLLQLKKLDLHHHFCSDEMIGRLEALPLEVDASEQNKAEVYSGETYRYCAVTE